ncbi:hypothetical protein GGR56DRAFT_416487 [Xylariaceae sp. FL0804]|nr:hypothetical protein GGR56DRAFT_416487 [Xylariaceae sp. FL0804]
MDIDKQSRSVFCSGSVFCIMVCQIGLTGQKWSVCWGVGDFRTACRARRHAPLLYKSQPTLGDPGVIFISLWIPCHHNDANDDSTFSPVSPISPPFAAVWHTLFPLFSPSVHPRFGIYVRAARTNQITADRLGGSPSRRGTSPGDGDDNNSTAAKEIAAVIWCVGSFLTPILMVVGYLCHFRSRSPSGEGERIRIFLTSCHRPTEGGPAVSMPW